MPMIPAAGKVEVVRGMSVAPGLLSEPEDLLWGVRQVRRRQRVYGLLL
jgi:hypothetical protein